MVCKIVLVVIVSVLLAIQPSSSSPIENEMLVELSGQFKILQNRMSLLEAENVALKTRVNFLERKDIENGAKISDQRDEIIQLKAKVDLRSSNYHQMNSIYSKEGSSDDSLAKAVLPSSCRDLSLIGHNLDGLYLVQNIDTKKVETIFCDFGTSIVQEVIGQVDVKTETVHFYVQRDSNFATSGSIIPFDVEKLNVGGAFDLTSGVFTVPVPGIYHFDFSAVKDRTANYLEIFLQVNGVKIGTADTSQGGSGSYDAVSLSASLRLAAGDSVNLFNYLNGELWDDSNHFTHFTGWLVEQDLS